MKTSLRICLSLCVAAFSLSAVAAVPATGADDGYRHVKDISYVSEDETDAYRLERCRLDIYYPENTDGFATLVWFHGGGLEGGSKSLLGELRGQGFAVVDVNYRLSPKIKANEAIWDAAEAVAWVLGNIEKFGGDPKRVFIGGHSAGAYLAGMVGFDPQYLEKFGYKNTDLAGMCLISGQMTTHFRVKSDLKYSGGQFLPVIDKYAVLNFVENDISPLLIVTGDDELEWPCRVAENRLLIASVKKIGKSPLARMFVLGGYGHDCAKPSAGLIYNFISDCLKRTKSAK